MINHPMPAYIERCAKRIVPVGSRVTCNPPPTDTDADYLVLLPLFAEASIFTQLREEGWKLCGSEVADDKNCDAIYFQSYRLGEVNLILTAKTVFFDKFLAASSIAKLLNVLSKHDRVALFQAVLYGNAYGDTAREMELAA